jgi:hypothetical protein
MAPRFARWINFQPLPSSVVMVFQAQIAEIKG